MAGATGRVGTTGGLDQWRCGIGGPAAALSAALAGCSVLAGCASPPPLPREPGEPLPAIRDELARAEADGLSGVLRVSVEDDVVLHEAYGVRDRTTGDPMTVAIGFDIGSITKVLTAVAVLRLVERDVLAVDDPVRSILPAATGPLGEVTLRQLATHTAGLPEYLGGDDEPVDREEAVARLLAVDLAFEPGTDEAYSNAGYSLLAILVEEAAGRPFEQVLREEVLVPAGVTGIGYVDSGWSRDELAVGYQRVLWLDRAWGTPLDRSWLADGPPWTLRGNGGLLATAEQLATWFDALYDGEVLGPEAFDTFYGWFGGEAADGSRRIGEAGGNDVFTAVHESWVDHDVHVTLLTSTPPPTDAESLWLGIEGLVADLVDSVA